MKKSDIVLLIAQHLIVLKEKDIMLEAESILNDLLKKGMLPPLAITSEQEPIYAWENE